MTGTTKAPFDAQSMDPQDIDSITVEISPGELIDKITILEIKLEHMSDAGKLQNVRHEHHCLMLARDAAMVPTPALDRLIRELHAINEKLWEIEDDIRDCERNKDFGPRFVELARAVYRTNDIRADLKKWINEIFGASIVEEKSYSDY